MTCIRILDNLRISDDTDQETAHRRRLIAVVCTFRSDLHCIIQRNYRYSTSTPPQDLEVWYIRNNELTHDIALLCVVVASLLCPFSFVGGKTPTAALLLVTE